MIYSDFNLLQPPHLVSGSTPLFIGCEFEIEDIVDATSITDLVSTTTDGSLRNNGLEFITPPLTVPSAIETFNALHKNLKYGKAPFTERTSIHVHANCCNLTQQEVKNIILLYALYEEAFFMMIDPSRRDNIHCVALTETHLPSLYRAPVATLISKWHKYTALNIKPLSQLGTIEFRHMHGHNDLKLFSEWVTLIENLFKLGRNFHISEKVFEEEALKTMFMDLFGGTGLSKHWPTVRGLMDNQIIDVKFSTL